MWAPINVNGIPTAKEILDAKKAIEEVEKQLQEALHSLEQARIRVADLESDLQQRRAWLAPIRRLNFDVLCHILGLAGENSWDAPIRLASVSQLWRFIALSIPRTWSFLDLKQMKNPNLINLYLGRSGQRLLHIGLSGYLSYITLAPMRQRLQCLSMYKFPPHLNGIAFPQVTRLRIRDTGASIYPTCVARQYFPSLRHLHCHSRFTREPGHRPEDDADWTYDLPPLETVDLQVCPDTTWACFLRNCSKTVTSLRLVHHGVIKPFQQQYSMTMPLLKCLEVSGRMVYLQEWPLKLNTPVLESYISQVEPSGGDRPLHSDLGTIKQMRLGGVRPLMGCTSLRCLQILNEPQVLYPILAMLEGDMALCPRLKVIVVVVDARFPWEDTEFTRRVEEVSKRRTGLKVLRQEVIMEKFKGEINSSCGEDMPCS